MIAVILALGLGSTGFADVDGGTESSWPVLELELTTALRRAFREIERDDFDQSSHLRRVCEVLWTINAKVNERPPGRRKKAPPVVTGAIQRALADEPPGDDARVRARAAFVQKIAEEAQLQPGTVWSEIAAPEIARRATLLRTMTGLSVTVFGGLATWAALEHAWVAAGFGAFVGIFATAGVWENSDEALRPPNRVRPALLRCEADLWRRTPRPEGEPEIEQSEATITDIGRAQ